MKWKEYSQTHTIPRVPALPRSGGNGHFFKQPSSKPVQKEAKDDRGDDFADGEDR